MMLLQQKVSGKFELKMFITGDGLMESIKRGLVNFGKGFGIWIILLLFNTRSGESDVNGIKIILDVILAVILTGNYRKGKYMAIAVTIVGTIAAIVYPMDDITDFLYLIGSVFAPMIAIQIADFFIIKKDSTEKNVEVANVVIWIIGFVLYRYLMTVDIIVGNTLPDMVITVIICVIVSKFGVKNAK